MSAVDKKEKYYCWTRQAMYV